MFIMLHNDFDFFVLVTKLNSIVNDMKQYVFVYPKVRANLIKTFVCVVNNFQFQVLSCEIRLEGDHELFQVLLEGILR